MSDEFIALGLPSPDPFHWAGYPSLFTNNNNFWCQTSKFRQWKAEKATNPNLPDWETYRDKIVKKRTFATPAERTKMALMDKDELRRYKSGKLVLIALIATS